MRSCSVGPGLGAAGPRGYWVTPTLANVVANLVSPAKSWARLDRFVGWAMLLVKSARSWVRQARLGRESSTSFWITLAAVATIGWGGVGRGGDDGAAAQEGCGGRCPGRRRQIDRLLAERVRPHHLGLDVVGHVLTGLDGHRDLDPVASQLDGLHRPDDE